MKNLYIFDGTNNHLLIIYSVIDANILVNAFIPANVDRIVKGIYNHNMIYELRVV